MAMVNDAPNSPQKLLRSILTEFFGTSDVDDVLDIAGALDFVRLDPGQILFRMGERSEDIYFVLSGRLRAVLEREHAEPAILGEIARGETVGELSLFTGDPRGATVMAVREALVARMTRPVFEKILSRSSAIAMATMRTVIDRFRRAEKQRRGPQKPAILCLLAITDGVDLRHFAHLLAAARNAYGGPVTVLDAQDVGGDMGSGHLADRVPSSTSNARLFAEKEAVSQLLILVADHHTSGWSRDCVNGADEILLVGRGDARPEVSDAEKFLLDSDSSRALAQQTLVLLHAPDCRSPINTAAWLDRRPVSRHFHIRHGVDRDMSRLARMLAGRGIGVVLSGGGARGFAHIGVLNALAEAGIEPDVIGGTSIGAVIGAWRAMDVRGEALTRAARAAFIDGGSPTSDLSLVPLISLVKGRKTRRVTEVAVRESAGADIDVEDTWTPFFCVSANYSTSTEAVLTRGPLSKSILASYAIPGALPPIPINGHLHVDGGTVNNLPVDVMERFGVGTIIAVDLLSDAVRSFDLEWIPRTLDLVVDRMRPRSRRRYSLPGLGEILLNASVLHSVGRQREMRDRADLCIRPVLHRVGLLDWKRFDIVVRSGHDSTVAALSRLSAEQLRAILGFAVRHTPPLQVDENLNGYSSSSLPQYTEAPRV